MMDSDGGVTILKQGLGSLVYDVSKVFGWLRIKTHECKWRFRVFVQNCQVMANFMQQGAWEGLRVLEIVCKLENNLYSYMKNIRGFEVDSSVRYRVMAMLLDFEEKWKTRFQGIVQAWPEFMGGSRYVAFAFDIACTQMKQVGNSMH